MSACLQAFDAIAELDLCRTHGVTLMMVTSKFVNTGDRTELDALLAEIDDHTCGVLQDES